MAPTQTIKGSAEKKLGQANTVYNLPSTEQRIKWVYTVCGYLVKSKWIKAIGARNFMGWPMLTNSNAKQYYPETSETPKEMLSQTRKNVRSTKIPYISSPSNAPD